MHGRATSFDMKLLTKKRVRTLLIEILQRASVQVGTAREDSGPYKPLMENCH